MCLQYVNSLCKNGDRREERKGGGGKLWINWDKRKEGILFEVDRREKLEIRGTTWVEEIKKKFAGLIASNKYVLLFRLHVYAFVEKHGCCRPFSSRKLSSFPYIASLLVCCSLKGTPWILIDVTEIESPFFFRRYCRIATYVGTTRGSKICNRI